MGTEMETLVIGNCLLAKADQAVHLASHYADSIDAD